MIRYRVASAGSDSESVLIELKKTFVFRGKEVKLYSPYKKGNSRVLDTDSGERVVAEHSGKVIKEKSLKSLELF